jgi:hypothetical protein
MLNDVDFSMDAKAEQCIIVKFLLNESSDAIEIHHKLLQQFQEDVYLLLSAYEWIKVFKTEFASVVDEHRGEWPRFDHIDSKIL